MPNSLDLLHKSKIRKNPTPPKLRFVSPPEEPTVYTQVKLPPLIPPYKGGKQEIQFPPQYIGEG